MQVYDAVHTETGEPCSIFYFDKQHLSATTAEEASTVLSRIRLGLDVASRCVARPRARPGPVMRLC